MNYSNTTLQIQNSNYSTEVKWYELYGSTWLIDSICLFILFPLSTIGFLLNLINFTVLRKKKFQVLPIFSYLKYYSINSSFVNFISMLLVIKTCKTYFDIFNNTIVTQIIICYIYIPFVNIFIFLGAALDIGVTLERNSQFFKVKNTLILKPRNMVLALLFFSVLINFQYFFITKPTILHLNINITTKTIINSFETTEFSSSLIGLILNSAGLIFRDVILLILQLKLSIKTIFLLRKHLEFKIENMFSLNETNISVNTMASVNHINKANKNLTVMVTIMGLLTCLEHTSLLIAYGYIKFFGYSFLAFLLSALIISFKYWKESIIT